MGRRKNTELNIYCAEGDPDYGVQYISALTGREARQIAMGLDVAERIDNPFINLRILKESNADTRYIRNHNIRGNLNIFEIEKSKLLWWDCPKCNSENIMVIGNGYNYKCLDCNFEGEVPYV